MMTRIGEFIEYQRVQRNASAHTLRAYTKDLELFIEQREDTGDVSVAEVRAFVASQMSDGRSRATAQRRLAALRSYFSYMHRQGYVKANPAKLVRSPKLQRKLPRFLTVDEAFDLVRQPDGMGFVLARDRAVLEITYGCGLRVSEVSGLDIADLDLDTHMMKVRGKGRKERLVPVGSKALEAFKVYHIERMLAGYDEQEPALFLNRKGSRLSDRSIRRLVKKYSAVLAQGGDVTPHTLRHTYASHLLQSGADLRVIQELLGHASLSTTQKYTHLDVTHLMAVYDKAHPLSGAMDTDEGKDDLKIKKVSED